MLLRSSCTAGPERLRGSRSGAVVSRRGRRGTKKRQRTRLCRFSHHVPSRKITKRSIAQPRQCRGQSRRYHPRSHPPILPERRIRRICPLSVLSPPAPGDASRPRLYLVFDIIAPLYADCKGKNEKFAFPSQWDFGSFAGVPRRGAGVRPVPGRGEVRRRPRASKPPFSFSEEKEKAPFDGVKRKRLGGGIPGFARNARGAFYGGFGLVGTCGPLPIQPHMEVAKAGGISGYPQLLFSLPHLGCCG